MEYKTLKSEKKGNIALVTVSRPEALNALNSQFFSDMSKMLDELKDDPEVKVVVITGEGKAFVAGADIAEMVSMNPEQGQDFSETGQKVFSKISKFRKPVIAAINGFALGGGLELAMACDFRLASSKAKFGQPEVNLGLIPGYAGTQRLSRLVGLGDALYMLMSGEMISSEDALRIGLVQKVCEPDALLDEALRIAGVIASKGPQAVSKVKYVTHKGYQKSIKSGSKLESEEFGTLFGKGSEGEEGMKAFLEKRKPSWQQ